MLLPAENIELRARIRAIPKLVEVFPEMVRFLRNGAIPPECEESYINILSEETTGLLKGARENIKPLDFVEMCTFGTWFEAFPEKVAGVERLMTSLAFPVSIKGNGDDVKLVINKTLSRRAQDERIKAKQQKTKAGSPLVRIELSYRHVRVNDALSGKLLKSLRRQNRTAFIRLFEGYPNFIERYKLKHLLTQEEREQVFPTELLKSRIAMRQEARGRMKRLKEL